MTEEEVETIKFVIPEKAVKNIFYRTVIASLFGVEVLKFDSEGKNKRLAELLEKAMRNAGSRVKRKPIIRDRPNEVGNDMEPVVVSCLKKVGLSAGKPNTKDGKKKTAGYPDIRIVFEGAVVYLEVKTYKKGNEKSSQRAFYLSPSTDPKIVEDAFHLLVGFEFSSVGNKYRPESYQVLDLYDLKCDLKFEYNSNGPRLYEKKNLLFKGKV